MKTGFVFCHGWGCAPDYWAPLLPFFTDHPVLLWDLGYFGDAFCEAGAAEGVEWFGIGHSLGFARLLRASLPLKGIVGLHPFLHFNKGVERYALQKTRAAMQRTPFETLKRFYQRAGLADYGEGLEAKRGSLRPEKLQADLLWLAQGDLTTCFRERQLPCNILASVDDPILSYESIQHDFQPFAEVSWSLKEEAQHDLGFHNTRWTADAIKTFVSL